MLIKQERFNSYEEALKEQKRRNDLNDGFLYGIPYDDTCCLKTYSKEEEAKISKKRDWSNTFKCDTPAYRSPITGKIVDGKTERREELKRYGCREVDPSEYKPEYQNKRFIEKHGIRQ